VHGAGVGARARAGRQDEASLQLAISRRELEQVAHRRLAEAGVVVSDGLPKWVEADSLGSSDHGVHPGANDGDGGAVTGGGVSEVALREAVGSAEAAVRAAWESKLQEATAQQAARCDAERVAAVEQAREVAAAELAGLRAGQPNVRRAQLPSAPGSRARPTDSALIHTAVLLRRRGWYMAGTAHQ
jgi:hypothetical protein